MRTFSFLGPNTVSLSVAMNGFHTTNNGTTVSTWYFREGSGQGFNGDRTIPSPVIEAWEGQTVNITLTSNRPHSIHLHGLDVPQAMDGVPGTSGYVAVATPTDGFGRVEGYVNLGSPFVYTFVAPQAGTYMYHCHIDTVLHVERGMIGTVIVRPPDGDERHVWDGGPAFDKEYLWHLHTLDSTWHSQMVSDANTVRHRPDFFMINGKDGSDLTDEPTVALRGSFGDRILVRATNVGYQVARVQLGGLPFDVVASDGRPLASTLTGVTELLIAPGERYDLIFTMPLGADTDATVEYYDGRLVNVLGTAATTIQETGLFQDDFESGDSEKWDNTVPG